MNPRRTIRRIHAADFEQLEPEGLDLGEHAVQRGLVRQRSDQHGVRPARLSPQGGERGAHRLAQVAAHTDLVLLRPAVCAGHVFLLVWRFLVNEPERRQDEWPTHDSDDSGDG
jgi:hypothetical protein